MEELEEARMEERGGLTAALGKAEAELAMAERELARCEGRHV